jgi:aspartate aminotransferase-like enzyme
MCPPGVSFLSLSDAAWKMVNSGDLPRFYWDFREMRKFSERYQTPFTPAITTLYGLNAALKIIRREGLDQILQRHARLARMVRAAIGALNLKLFAQRPANALTTVEIPHHINGERLLRFLHDRLGAVAVGGQARLKGKIFRLAHLGYVDEFDVIAAIAALEKGLLALGHTFNQGAGLLAAQKEISEPKDDEI